MRRSPRVRSGVARLLLGPDGVGGLEGGVALGVALGIAVLLDAWRQLHLDVRANALQRGRLLDAAEEDDALGAVEAPCVLCKHGLEPVAKGEFIELLARLEANRGEARVIMAPVELRATFNAALASASRVAAAEPFLCSRALGLASVGRMALSNYLLQSILCTLIFYGHGLGQFGTWDRTEQMLLVGGLTVCQLIWSPMWLSTFRFGPAEWLWRTLTYWRLQPMRRPSTNG